MKLTTLRRTAAEIAAAAVFEMYPQVELLGGGETSSGFFYEFVFPHPVNPDTLPLIEERMRQIVKERRAIRTLEMVPVSARELLKKEGHLAQAESLEEDGLVEVIQIGTFHALSGGPHLKNTNELSFFKLLSVERFDEKGMRISGSAHWSKEELKEHLKRVADYNDKNHLKVGEKKGLWIRLGEDLVWKDKGLKLRECLIQFLKSRLFADAAEIAGPYEAARPDLHLEAAKQMKKNSVGEVLFHQTAESEIEEAGLFNGYDETQILLTALEAKEDILISSLQSIDQTLKILGFNWTSHLMGRKASDKGFQRLSRASEKLGWSGQVDLQEGQSAQIDFMIEDEMGREWPVVQVRGKVREAEGVFVSLFVEKILALLLEKNLEARLNNLECSAARN